MSDTRSPIAWNSLADDLMERAKYGKIRDIQAGITDDISETNSEASNHSNTSRYRVTNIEREAVRSLDHHFCFVTKLYSCGSQVVHILDKSDAGNRQLVDALRGLGIVHREFNLADISNLLLMSREMHYLWDKHATFVIVPSQETRKRMVEIVNDDRNRIAFALENKHAVEPCQMAYPETITYDIILFQPSLLGDSKSYFQYRDNHNDNATLYKIPDSCGYLTSRREYLIKQDDEAQIYEFLNMRHITSRSIPQAVNPYLVVMNALPKLDYWHQRGIGADDSTRDRSDLVVTSAYEDCRRIMRLMSRKTGATILMSRVQHDGEAQGSKEGDMDEEKDPDKTTPSGSTKDLPAELGPSLDLGHLLYDPPTQQGMQSWISRGNFNKANSLETWRQEIRELGPTVQALNGDPE